MGVSIADLVRQILAEPYKKPAKGDGNTPCPDCVINPRPRLPNGTFSSYCVECRLARAKTYRERYAAKALPKNN